MMKTSQIFNYIITFLVVIAMISTGLWVHQWLDQARVLRKVVERLSAESRVAEVLVTKSEYDEETKKIKTTIKFLEYDADTKPLSPKYFTFQGNIIQFQALVIRFQDQWVKKGDKLRGKSAFLFMKAFILDGEKTQEFEISKTEDIPRGYKIPEEKSQYEAELWREFWKYALDPKMREHAGIKSAQIEAPGSLFVPGTIYTLKIEHDGGIRIDAQPVPEILKGEKV